MSAKRKPEGDLLLRLDGDEQNAYRAPRGRQPREGVTTRLWRIPGTWSVWSAGPTAGTWWLQPADDEARRVAVKITEKPHRAHPVVVRVWRDCIAVRSRDIR